MAYLEHTVVLEERYYLGSDLDTVHYENGTNGLLKTLDGLKMLPTNVLTLFFFLFLFLFPISSIPFIPMAWYRALNGNQPSSFLSWQCNHPSSQMESFPCSRLCPKKVYKHRSNVETNCAGWPYRLNILASEIKQSSASRRRGAGTIVAFCTDASKRSCCYDHIELVRCWLNLSSNFAIEYA